MSNFIKEPSIKLIPSDPMTNTILIIYCVSSTGASVPYKSIWRKINPKNNRVQEIKSNNGSSYRCSPLDIDCLIQATVYFQHQNLQLSRIVQSNAVKVSRELKDRKQHIRQPILARIAIDEIVLESKIFIQEGALNIMLAGTTVNPNYLLPINDIAIQLDGSHLVFKVIFKEKMELFLEFVALLLGWKPQSNNHFITLTFGSDINRDIILLGIAEYLQKTQTVEKQGYNITINTNDERNQQKQNRIRDFQQQDGCHNKNKSQTSLSPAGAYKEKFKLAGKLVEMKRSFNNLQNVNQQATNQKKNEPKHQSKTQHKLQTKEKFKDRQCLNIFQQDQLQLLGPPRPVSFDVAMRPKLKPQAPNPNDQPSMNLRGSFQQLEKSFSSNLNEQMVERLFKMQNGQQTKRLHQEIIRLQRQNQQLKKQVEGSTALAKQNNTLKRKYHEMKEEINRLQMQRKVILTDKLRCEVNWHKEIQEKQQFKKELQYLRETAKANQLPNNYTNERAGRTHSTHDVQSFDRKLQNRQANQNNRDLNRSPNGGLYR